jgi:hypothetical protein
MMILSFFPVPLWRIAAGATAMILLQADFLPGSQPKAAS